MLPSELSVCGIAVFPCDQNKQPLIHGGFKSATTSPPAEWDRSPYFGTPCPGGHVIIDLDTDKGVTRSAVESVLGCRLDWDSSLLQNTPSGGTHHLFKLPPEVIIRQGSDLLGVAGFDTRTEGHGYICVYGDFNLITWHSAPLFPNAACDALAPPVCAEPSEMPTGQSDPKLVRELLYGYFDPDCGRDEWMTILRAVRHHFHDDPDAGFELFDQWSSETSVPGHYDPGVCRYQWYKTDPVKGDRRSVTFGSLIFMASERGYQPSANVAEMFASIPAEMCQEAKTLIETIRSDAGLDGAANRLSALVKNTPMPLMDREETISILFESLKLAGKSISKRELRKACEPDWTVTVLPPIPTPDVCEFDDLRIVQDPAVDGNHGRSARVINDRFFCGKLVTCGGEFYWWNGLRFQLISDDQVKRKVGQAYGDGEDAKIGNKNGTFGFMDNTVPTVAALGEPDHRIFFKNGVLDPVTWTMSTHSRDNLNTYTTTVDFDESATCPNWDSFIAQIFRKEPEREQFLYELLGWFMCNDMIGIEKGVLFYGATRAGKGTIIDVMQSILGSGARTASIAQYDDPKIILPLRHANVAIDPEAEELPRNQAREVQGIFKAITANDELSIPLMYKQQSWNGKLNCKVWAASNNIPEFDDNSGATATRWLPLLFDISFADNQDIDLKKRLRTELTGIALKAARGLQRLIANNKKFSLPASSISKLAEMRMGGGAVSEFFYEFYEITGEECHRIHSKDMWNDYRLKCESEGMKFMRLNDFRKKLKTVLLGTDADHKSQLKINDVNLSGFVGVRRKPCDIGLTAPLSPVAQLFSNTPPSEVK